MELLVKERKIEFATVGRTGELTYSKRVVFELLYYSNLINLKSIDPNVI